MRSNKIIRRKKEVTKTPEGKNVQLTSYNKLTKKGTTKEKDITYKSKDNPRIKFVEKEVVKRDKDMNWKSLKNTKKLFEGGKKIKKSTDFEKY